MVPEEHTSMTPSLKHLKPHETPSGTHMWPGLSIAPPMQSVVVDRVPVVNPQLASIIRQNTESIVASPEESHAA
jgi:hypothetical protein